MDAEDVWMLNCPGEAIRGRSGATMLRRVPSLFRMSGELMVGDRSLVFAPDGSYMKNVAILLFGSSAVTSFAFLFFFPDGRGFLVGALVFISAGLTYFMTTRMSRASAHGYLFRVCDVSAFDELRGVLELSTRAGGDPLADKGLHLRLRLKLRDPAALVPHIRAK